MYWRFSEKDETIEEGYPRDMSMWGGVPTPVDAAMQHVNGKSRACPLGDLCLAPVLVSCYSYQGIITMTS